MGHEEKHNFGSMLEALSFLIKDEAEAVDGYERVLAMPDLKPEHRVELEKIRNAEIDHVHDLSKLYEAYSNIHIVGTDSRTVKDSKKWDVCRASSGQFYFKDSEGVVYTDSRDKVVTFEDKETAGEFYIKNLYHADAWGSEVPKILEEVKDSVVQDYSARGSFNSVDELKKYYNGAQFVREGDYVTVLLKGGAELVYSVLGGGRVAFIRGRN